MKNIIIIPIIGAVMMMLIPERGKQRVREVALITSIVTLMETLRLYVTMEKGSASYQHVLEVR